jgi:hypothetical protein
MSAANVTPDEFVRELFGTAPGGACAWICTKADGKGSWQGRIHDPEQPLPHINGEAAYISIAAFPPDAPSRAMSHQLGVLAIVPDDIGTKADPAEVLRLFGPPTAEIETSQGNCQWAYVLDTPISKADADLIHDKLKAKRLLTDGKGLSSVRYFRLPAGINGKPEGEKKDFRVHLKAWRPTERRSLAFFRERLEIVGERDDSGRKTLRYAPPDTVHAGRVGSTPTADYQPGDAEGRNEELLAYGRSLGNLPDDKLLRALHNENIARYRPPVEEQEFRTIYKSVCNYRDKSKTAVDSVNDAHALIYIKGKCGVMWKDGWQGGVPTISSVTDVKKYWDNKKKGGPLNPIDIWMQSPERDTFRDIVYEPGILETGEALNLFTGWGTQAVKGDCSLILSHIHDVICRGNPTEYQYVIQWLANLVQFPRDKPGTALFIRAGQGVGKGTLGNYLERMLGTNYLFLNHSDQLMSRFNDFLAGKLLVFTDEVVWPHDARAVAKLKSYFTERNILIEPKFVPAFTIPNHARFILITNEQHAAPAEIDDRRCVVLVASERYRDKYKYWNALEAEAKGQGPAALLYHLLHEVKITLELRENLKTEALAQQKLLNLDNVGRFWRAALMLEKHELIEGYGDDKRCATWSYGDVVPTTLLHRFFLDFAARSKFSHPESLDAFGKKLREHVTAVRREATAEEVVRLGLKAGERHRVYALPKHVDARVQFERRIGHEVDWFGHGTGDAQLSIPEPEEEIDA